MRINDGSICGDCRNFEHECSNTDDWGCTEYCMSKDNDVAHFFYAYDEPVLQCKDFKKG